MEDIIEHIWRSKYNVSLSRELLSADFSKEDLIYQGPFDVLLQLIDDKQIDIMDIKLAELTDQYLAYISAMEQFDMDISSDFIEMAAKLIYIKSRSILPKEEEEIEEDEIEIDIKTKLMLYKMFKERAEELKKRETIYRFYKLPDFSEKDIKLSFINFNVEKLIRAYVEVLAKSIPKQKQKEEKKIERYEFSLSDRIKLMIEKLEKNKKIEFMSLFNKKVVDAEIITSFLAMLELCKIQATTIEEIGPNNFNVFLNENIDLEHLMNKNFDSEYAGDINNG